MCLHCGLILCTLNLPQYVCPHCSAALHKPEDRDALVAKLDQELEETLRKEEAERERLAQQIQKAQSEFPSLPGTRTPSRSPSSQSLKAQQPPPQTSHKVLSINPKSKKVIISSKVKATSIPASISASPSQDSVSAEPRRIPRPSPEVIYSSKEPDSGRPWAPMLRPRVTYIPPASIVSPTPSKGQRKSVKSP
ncbi:hypothetical protein NLI96_g9159 [Meripilus lineatus]|uniref:TRIP4/RQT4 C2HC5-type zinc finger domain-containing protein n=1 Tax=Meripilus lineatus TaxID=2056292 RepID=A0AAD5YAI9_9APHY|nr:hypothetical protein NLI96_g9159 [Physisporinus lineatus]